MKEKVTYHKAFGISLIAGAVFILSVSLLIGISLNTLTGGILLIVGILYLNNAALEYDKDELHIKNLYGSSVRKYSFHADKIEMKDGAIYSNNSRVRIAATFLNKTELNQLHEFISNKDFLNS